MIVDYIDSDRGSFGVEPICAVLAEAGIVIAPSTYYARRQARLTDAEMDDAYLANQLRSTGVSTVPASCGMRLAAPATTSAATRWPG
jgi:hypothetical protein